MKWRPGGKRKLPTSERERGWEYWRREYQFPVNKQNWLRYTNVITYLSTQWKLCFSEQLQSNSTTLRKHGKQILILYTLVVINGTDIRINSIFKIVGIVICFLVHLTNICIKPNQKKKKKTQTKRKTGYIKILLNNLDSFINHIYFHFILKKKKEKSCDRNAHHKYLFTWKGWFSLNSLKSERRW